MTDIILIEIPCIIDEFCKYCAVELKNKRWTAQANAVATVRASQAGR